MMSCKDLLNCASLCDDFRIVLPSFHPNACSYSSLEQLLRDNDINSETNLPIQLGEFLAQLSKRNQEFKDKICLSLLVALFNNKSYRIASTAGRKLTDLLLKEISENGINLANDLNSTILVFALKLKIPKEFIIEIINLMSVAAISIVENKGRTALDFAIRNYDYEIFVLLLRKFDKTLINDNYLYASRYICDKGFKLILDCLTNVSHDDIFTYMDEAGLTVFDRVLESECPNKLEICFNYFNNQVIEPSAKFKTAYNILLSVVLSDNFDAFNFVLCKLQNFIKPNLNIIDVINYIDERGNTLLHIASIENKLQSVLFLLKNMSPKAIAQINKNGRVAYHFIKAQYRFAFFEDKGLHVFDNLSLFELTYLDIPAALYGSYINKNKSTINDRNSNNETPLMIAVALNRILYVKELIKKGAKLDVNSLLEGEVIPNSEIEKFLLFLRSAQEAFNKKFNEIISSLKGVEVNHDIAENNLMLLFASLGYKITNLNKSAINTCRDYLISAVLIAEELDLNSKFHEIVDQDFMNLLALKILAETYISDPGSFVKTAERAAAPESDTVHEFDRGTPNESQASEEPQASKVYHEFDRDTSNASFASQISEDDCKRGPDDIPNGAQAKATKDDCKRGPDDTPNESQALEEPQAGIVYHEFDRDTSPNASFTSQIAEKRARYSGVMEL